jgi:hypothetical protein
MKTLIIILGLMTTAFSSRASAGVYELGGQFSYQHNTYNGGAFTYTRMYAANLGYYFTEDSEVEFSYQDSTNEDYQPGVQDITYRDRVYSLNFLYHLFEEKSAIRPYFRVGIGQLNRDQTGTYAGGFQPGGTLDQVTVIGGFGIKAKIIGRFSLKAEATTYLLNGAVSSWRDNLAVSIGGSVYF